LLSFQRIRRTSSRGLENAVVQHGARSVARLAREHHSRIPGHFVHAHHHTGQEQVALDVVQVLETEFLPNRLKTTHAVQFHNGLEGSFFGTHVRIAVLGVAVPEPIRACSVALGVRTQEESCRGRAGALLHPRRRHHAQARHQSGFAHLPHASTPGLKSSTPSTNSLDATGLSFADTDLNTCSSRSISWHSHILP
jgi:hypothetical protein